MTRDQVNAVVRALFRHYNDNDNGRGAIRFQRLGTQIAWRAVLFGVTKEVTEACDRGKRMLAAAAARRKKRERPTA